MKVAESWKDYEIIDMANGEKLEDGIYHISTQSLLEYPHNYKVIEIKTQKNHKPRIYTQLRHADVLF